MKRLFLLASFWAISTAASAQVMAQYVTQMEGADAAGAAFNAALQSGLRESGAIRLASSLPEDRSKLRIVFRSLPLAGLTEEASVYEILVLVDVPSDGTYFINSYVGYAGVDRAPELAKQHAKEIIKYISEARKDAKPN